MEDLMKNLSEKAKEAAENAVTGFNQLKDAAAEKLKEFTDKADAMAAEEEAKAAQQKAETESAKEQIAQHEGGALGYLTDKAKEIVGDIKEEASDLVQEGKDFWDKARDYVSGDKK